MAGGSRIGLICHPDHEVFSVVATLLRDRDHQVEFFEPGTEIPPSRLESLDVLVNKKIRWESLHALEYAHRNDVTTWNGYIPTVLFVNRLSQLAALEMAGFETPDTLPEPPSGEYVGRSFLDIQTEPTISGDGDLFQPLLDTDRVDRKYYAVLDGTTMQTVAVEFKSKLFGEREFLGRIDVDPTIEARIERLFDFSGARGLGVDVIEVGGESIAVDVNPATSFRRTGLEAAIADSIESRLE